MLLLDCKIMKKYLNNKTFGPEINQKLFQLYHFWMHDLQWGAFAVWME